LSLANDLVATALKRAKAGPKKPRQADLRRAASTAYDALFHAIAENGANLIVSGVTSVPDKTWSQAYRMLDHGFAKNACREIDAETVKPGKNPADAIAPVFPAPVGRDRFKFIADTFISLQEQRHEADYKPLKTFTRATALNAISDAASAISELENAGRSHRLAFAVHLLMKRR
jgi:uncharacterized protein (UPF0332 family)